MVEKMKDKERFMLYVKIAQRAEGMGIYTGERHTLLMDLESADNAFNLRLDDLLLAPDTDFIHDVNGITAHVNRTVFPATDFGLFVPRYAGQQEEK